MKKIIYLFLLSIPILTARCSSGQSTIATRIVKDSLFIPWEIIWGPDNNIWLDQKNGYICRLNPTTSVLDTLYHETSCAVLNEGGMLGMALHPQFTTQPYVYVVYNYYQGTVYRERVVRYTYNGTNALGSPFILLDGVNASSNHNGSRLLIVGDKLFYTSGDVLNGSNAQNLAVPNGKIHRMNPDGTIPSDNPIAGSTIWSWGHRNAQGLVYANGILYSSEHGNTTDDEVNIIKKGRNYGWPTVEGFCDKPSETQFCTDSNVVQPLWAWTPTIAPCGIDYYTQPMFPAFQGKLLMTSLKDTHLYEFTLNTTKDSITASSIISAASFGRLRDICISPSGRIYLSTSNSGSSGTGAKIDRIVELYDPNATAVPRLNTSNITLYPNPAHSILHVESAATAAQYTIYNSVGQSILFGPLTKGRADINTAPLPPATYILRINDPAGTSSNQLFLKE